MTCMTPHCTLSNWFTCTSLWQNESLISSLGVGSFSVITAGIGACRLPIICEMTGAPLIACMYVHIGCKFKVAIFGTFSHFMHSHFETGCDPVVSPTHLMWLRGAAVLLVYVYVQWPKTQFATYAVLLPSYRVHNTTTTSSCLFPELWCSAASHMHTFTSL